jgi:hypothetical protein
MKFIKILLPVALFGFFSINALEKPETADIDPSTASLEQTVDQIKAEGNLGPIATKARALETKRLTQRYLELGLKTNKTDAEKKEFQEIGAELKTRIGTAISNLLPAQ